MNILIFRSVFLLLCVSNASFAAVDGSQSYESPAIVVDSLSETYFSTQDGPLNKFEIGPEFYASEYTETIGVKDTGNYYGVFASFTHRLGWNDNIRSLKDVFGDNNKINMYRLEGRFATASIKYEGSGTESGIRDYVTEVRGIVGYDIPIFTQTRITPISGFGFRYLFDGFSKTPAKTINGQNYYSGYDRESFYYYIPLGVEVERKISQGWSIQGSAEYDFFIYGKQISHFEDMHDSSGVNAGYDALSNDQKRGMGFRAALRVTKSLKHIDLFVEPFYRFWHIQDSEVDYVTAGGSTICFGGLCQAGLEPNNKTKEAGVKAGINF